MAIPFIPGGGISHGGGGGGAIPGGSGSTPTPGFVPFLENGGFAATAYYLFIPAQSSEGGPAYIATFQPSNWNDTTNGGSYSYRQEDILIGRQPTIRRVILVYRDLGVATITVTLSGTNDNLQIVNAVQTVTLGTTNASQALLTALVDVELTAFRPQLTISRAAGAGPVSIVSASLVGEVEDVTL